MKTLPYLFRKPLKSLSLYSLLCFLLFTNMKCKKYFPEPGPETLPAETQTGARTFGCLVDGKIWLPKGNFPYSSLSTTIQYNILSLNTSRSNENIIIAVRNMIDIGNYDLILNNNYADYNIDGIVYKAIEGTVSIIKYDKSNKILSGRFNFTGKDNSTGKTVSITEGRFDVTFTN